MNSSTVLIIVFISLAIGFFAGLLTASLSSSSKTSENGGEEEPVEVVDDPPEDTAQPVSQAAQPEEVEPEVKQPEMPDTLSEETLISRLISSTIENIKQTKTEPDSQNETAEAGSIVQQIDDILQSQIFGTELYKKGVRLVDTPDEGVTVWVGLEHYHGIDTVDDQEVLYAIRTAVKTWESKKG